MIDSLLNSLYQVSFILATVVLDVERQFIVSCLPKYTHVHLSDTKP